VSLLIAQGEHPKLIAEQVGHASVQITLDRYGHLMDQSYGDASGRLDAALFGASALPASTVHEGATAFRSNDNAESATPLPMRVSAAGGGTT
jgi:hypothetical protein